MIIIIVIILYIVTSLKEKIPDDHLAKLHEVATQISAGLSLL